MYRFFLIIAVASLALFNIAIASVSPEVTVNGNISRLTTPAIFGIYNPLLTLSNSALSPLISNTGKVVSGDYIDVHAALLKSPLTYNLVLNDFTLSETGHTNITSTSTFAVGKQPSILSLGNGYYLEVNSTQGAHAIQGYILKITNNTITVEDSEYLGRGINPSIAVVGGGYYLILCSNNNYLAAYVLKATDTLISPPATVNSYAAGNMPSVIAMGSGKFLEINNDPSSGHQQFYVLSVSATIHAVTIEPITISSDNNVPTQDSKIYLSTTNIPNPSSNGNQILEVYSNASGDGLYSSLLYLSNNDTSINISTPYEYGQFGYDPTILPLAGDKFFEMDSNTIGDTGNLTLFSSILH